MSFVVLIPFLVFGGNYKLVEERKGNTFFDGFNFESHGGTFSDFILSESEAESMGLINNTDNQVYIGTDYWNKVNDSGRPAIQIGSKSNYSNALIITDLSHMPYGCGVWPAWWLDGPNWPNNGEIDMIEGINLRSVDQATLHTNDGCYYTENEANIAKVNMTGTWHSYNCSYQPGCSIVAESGTYGGSLNNIGGGVFAVEINDNIGIRIWFWDHDNTPSDVVNKIPNPNNDDWGKPFGFWPNYDNCNMAEHFKEMRIIFDLYYCGWSGNDPTWKSECSDDNGPAKGQTCEEFVMNNPSYFMDAYWLINYLDVYQQ